MLTASNVFVQTMTSHAPKEVFVKLEIYDKNMNFIYELTDKVDATSLSNISVDRSRSIRRSFSFALDNSSPSSEFSWGENNLIWIDKRVKVYTGLKLPSGDIEYVLQGTYIVSDIYEDSTLDSKKTYITGQDKAFLLGENYGKINSIFKALVGEDMIVYPEGESPADVLTKLNAHSSIPFVQRLLNPATSPLPTLSLLDLFSGGEEISLHSDPITRDFFANKKITHALLLKPSPSGTTGEDPYRVYSKIFIENGVYQIIHDEDAALSSAVERNDFIDFPTYYDATIFMIHAFQRNYFEYYQSQGIDIGETTSQIRPETTPTLTFLIQRLLDLASETQPLIILNDLPVWNGDPNDIEFGSNILTRDLEYSEGTTFISIIEELAALLNCEFYYDVEGRPVLKLKELNNFQKEPVVWTYNFTGQNRNSYAGNERKLNISNLANQINVYTGGLLDASYQYRLAVSDQDSLFASHDFAKNFTIEKIGRLLYSHNNGQPDPVLKTKKQAILTALWHLKNKLGYTEELPVQITPNYLLEPGDIIRIIDSSSNIDAKYVIEKIDVPIMPTITTMECKRENLIDFDWDTARDILLGREGLSVG